MKFLTVLFSYLPLILKAVQDMEAAIGAGNGSTKKALVLSVLDAIAKDGETVDNALVALISKLIDSVVTVLNAAKIFTKAA